MIKMIKWLKSPLNIIFCVYVAIVISLGTIIISKPKTPVMIITPSGTYDNVLNYKIHGLFGAQSTIEFISENGNPITVSGSFTVVRKASCAE